MAEFDGEMTVIGADTHIEGKMTFQKGAKINGKFDGEVTGPGELTVSNNAVCRANVDAGSVNVNGSVEGNVRAKDKVALNNGGRVKGDIVAAKMVMAEGAALFGNVAVGPDAQRQVPPSPGQPAPGNPGAPGAGPQPPKK